MIRYIKHLIFTFKDWRIKNQDHFESVNSKMKRIL